MVDRAGQYTNPFPLGRPGSRPVTRPERQGGSARFDDVLHEKLNEGVRLSAHAEARLRASRIPFGSDQMNRLNKAVEKAAAKGARESLVLMDNVALVVSVRNRTVITAVAPDRVKENVFTNIDSAVIT